VRSDVPPLNQPAAGTSPEVVAASKTASTEAFHLAMAVSAAFLAVGAAVNWFGISDQQALVTANSERRSLAT
jgi:hypothetical protein